MPSESQTPNNAAAKGSPSGTLAEKIRLWREKRYMTPALLAQKANVPLRMVEDIEAGIEHFLAPAVRQRIAKALHVRPDRIRELEKMPVEDASAASLLRRRGQDLREAILQDPEATYHCPDCEALLSVRLFERRDLHDRPLLVIKAHCTQCLFRMTDD